MQLHIINIIHIMHVTKLTFLNFVLYSGFQCKWTVTNIRHAIGAQVCRRHESLNFNVSY